MSYVLEPHLPWGQFNLCSVAVMGVTPACYLGPQRLGGMNELPEIGNFEKRYRMTFKWTSMNRSSK